MSIAPKQGLAKAHEIIQAWQSTPVNVAGPDILDTLIADALNQLAQDKEDLANAGEYLWVVLANASGGDWRKETKEWQEAAAKARDQFHAVVSRVGITNVA